MQEKINLMILLIPFEVRIYLYEMAKLLQVDSRQLYMLQSKQFDKLVKILNFKEQTLDEIEANFLTVFNQSTSVFKATHTINNLINLNLLTHQQRIIALFLLIENYKSQGIKKHPFASTILDISLRTTQPFQRKMIADLIIDSKREQVSVQYSNIAIELLFDSEQVAIQRIEQIPEIRKLREDIKAQLPSVSQDKKCEVYNLAINGNKLLEPLEDEVNPSILKQQEKCNLAFNIGNLRPIPEFLPVHQSQLAWLSLGTLTDIHWDNTAEIQKKIAKCRILMKKAMQNILQKEEITQIERSIENEPYAVLNLDIYPQHLQPLIKYNPQVVASFLIKLANYPSIGEYLDILITYQISLNIIEVITRITRTSKIPAQFFQLFVLRHIKQFLKTDNKEKIKIMRIFATFMRSLIKNRLLKTEKYEEDLQALINKHIQFEEIKNLKYVLAKKQQ